MVAIKVVNLDGAVQREVELDVDQLDSHVRRPLLKEALIAYLASQRQGTHSTKTRSEVAGGKTKPYRQKGTGRARQGSIRATQFVGGGRAHGPKPRDYSYRLPKQQRRLAVRSSLRFQAEAGRIVAIEGLDALEAPKTKVIAQALAKVGLNGKAAVLVSEGVSQNLYLSARNLQRVDIVPRADLCAGKVLQRGNIVLSAAALDALVKEIAE